MAGKSLCQTEEQPDHDGAPDVAEAPHDDDDETLEDHALAHERVRHPDRGDENARQAARAEAMAKEKVYTLLRFMPMRLAASLFWDVAGTALPMTVFLRNR